MDIKEQIDRLKTIHNESCYPTHTTISSEPEYTCQYCNHSDVAPSHTEDCPCVECALAANTMEAMLKVVEATKSYIAALRDPSNLSLQTKTGMALDTAISNLEQL